MHKSISFSMFMIGRLVETIYMIRLVLLLPLLVEYPSLFNCSSLFTIVIFPNELETLILEFDLILPTPIELDSIGDNNKY